MAITIITTPLYAAEIKIVKDKVYVLGTIDQFDDQKFQRMTEPYDQEMRIILHSKGGWLQPARNIGNLIRLKAWDTHVEHECSSACVSILLAGVKVTKTPNARIGFHTASNIFTGKRSNESNAQGVLYFRHLGYSEEVGKYGTESFNLKYLTDADAVNLGIKIKTIPYSIPPTMFANVDLNRRAKAPVLATSSSIVTRFIMPHCHVENNTWGRC